MHSPRRLVVVRHAKAEQFAPSDIERELSPRGRSDGRALGEWLGSESITPDVVYVSPAARTRGTWEVVAQGAGWTLEPVWDAALYGTDEEGVLELVHATDDAVRTIVVIGHNPTMGMLVQLLDDGSGAATGSVDLGSFPTSTAAVLEFEGVWTDLTAMQARLQQFHVARTD